MGKIIFITGGARSGKSSFAEKLATGFGKRLCYLATAQTLDGEMRERVRLHRERRGTAWQTVEEPLQLPQALERCDGTYQAILVDCVTLWLSNLLVSHEKYGYDIEARIAEDISRLERVLQKMETPVVIVSNEVGMGIVPENRLARLFRDIAGRANQSLAATADDVYAVISGLPLKLKSMPEPYIDGGGG